MVIPPIDSVEEIEGVNHPDSVSNSEAIEETPNNGHFKESETDWAGFKLPKELLELSQSVKNKLFSDKPIK